MDGDTLNKTDVRCGCAGHRVGYGDASHFTRDYKRLFGAPPARDIGRLREAPQQKAATVSASL
jgi:AraC-like DNA-binding protein